MNGVIVGHTNTDLDCIGSIVLASHLFPDFTCVKSRLILPIARNLYNIYANKLNHTKMKDVADMPVDKIVIVDTRTYQQVKEYMEPLRNRIKDIEIFDHHVSEKTDIEGAVVHERSTGSNTTLLGLELMMRNIAISPEAATIALLGIYADTGNFTHDNVTDDDFQVSSFLLRSGASLKIVKNYLNPLKDEHLSTLFRDMLSCLSYTNIHGNSILLSYLVLERQTGGLGAVVERMFDIENADAMFSVFAFEKEHDVLIIARAKNNTIDVRKVMEHFGGGGHRQASSAHIKNASGDTVVDALKTQLQCSLRPAMTALDIMTKEVFSLNENWSLLEASKYLEFANHSGAPVINNSENLVGFLTLKDIMKGRKVGQMHVPVKAFMTKKVICSRPDATLREIEQLMNSNNIGHLPILENGRLYGIVTRSDFLRSIDHD